MALSEHQMDILRRLATGDRHADVATDLGISHQTLKNTLTLIYKKLEVRGLVETYAALGWLKAPGEGEA